MSSEVPSAAPRWPVLSMSERRVLGVMVEKAKTTPDTYPLSLNALVTGCNQKSNRDPLLNLSDADVEDTLASCQKKGLAVKITGGRVERWRHTLYESWHVDKVELSILAELLLRGPQTEGELRGRASRMEPIADVDALRAVLKPMAERKLIVYLTEENRRGTTLTHGFHEAGELGRLRAAAPVAPSTEPRSRAPEADQDDVLTQVAALRNSVAELQATVADLQEQVRALRAGREQTG
jgi:uncharacterized protein YceH (UPF0502 family)